MKTYILLLALLLIPAVTAHNQPHPPIEVGESIVNAELSCKGLDKEQILAIGIYLYGDSQSPWWTRTKARLGYCIPNIL